MAGGEEANGAVRPDEPDQTDGRWVGRAGRGEVFEFAFDAYLVTDAQGLILDCNGPAARLLQCRQEFLPGKPLGLFVTDPDRPAFYRRLAQMYQGGTAEALDLRVGRRGADPRDVLAVAAPVRDGEEGRPTTYRWLLRDVTGLRRTESELRQERLLLERLVDAAEAAILVVDANGLVLRSNPYLHDMTGFEADELRGRDWGYTLLVPADRPVGRRVLGQAFAHGSGRTGPLGVRTRGGARRAFVWSARGLPGPPAARAVLVGHDVTELQDAQAQAVRAERLAAIGQMAAGLAHESRNALQRGQACLSLLGLRLAGHPEALDLLERAQKAQDDLHRLYEGVLDYAAPLRLDPDARCDLLPVWREAWADLAWAPGWRTAELTEGPGETEPTCRADPFHMRRVFRNLFENARAAADPVRVTVRWGPAELSGTDALRVRVRDDGPGFPPEARGRLFEAFFTTKTHGTGLGLALCKRVVDEHGGRIEAVVGPGAEIIITLPRSTP